MFQMFVLGIISAIDACIRSPAWIVRDPMEMAGAGMSSYHAE
jgi:hypothetical protein